MSITKRIIDSENINGFNITLNVEKRKDNPISQRFVISYKKQDPKSAFWTKAVLTCIIICNMITIRYLSVNITATVVFFLVCTFLILFWATHSVQSETLLIIPTVGLQSSIKYVIGTKDSYVSWSYISDVIINEVFEFNRIVYGLTVLIKNDSEMDHIKLLPFRYTKPRLMMLEVIYLEIQSLLIDSMEDSDVFKDGVGSGDK